MLLASASLRAAIRSQTFSDVEHRELLEDWVCGEAGCELCQKYLHRIFLRRDFSDLYSEPFSIPFRDFLIRSGDHTGYFLFLQWICFSPFSILPPMRYLVLAYYSFFEIEDPKALILGHKKFLKDRDVSGRIYISEEGVNGQMSAAEDDAHAYMEWLTLDPRFANQKFKIHEHSENCFPRMTVKYRKQLVALDCEVDLEKGGQYLSPHEWKEKLESENPPLLIDVRNDYETEIGHFEGAVCPPLKTFRDFPKYADALAKEHDPKSTEVMMCCTGGIRCELYSALLKERGFDTVYQLDGGIIDYGLKVGSDHWKGKLFVFDDRMAVPVGEQEQEPISVCSHCNTPCDHYHNCSNMECNELFLACDACWEKMKGACSSVCACKEDLRPIDESQKHKPFRRLHLLKQDA